MPKTRYITTIILISAWLLAGCGGDSADDVQRPVEKERQEISINTNVTKMQTRATTIDNDEALRSYDLRIDAFYNNTNTAYLSGTRLHYSSVWKFWDGTSQLHYYWPIEGSKYGSGSDYTSLDFVGYCPDVAPYITILPYNHSTGASFSCNLSSYMTNKAQSSIVEYLISILKGQTYTTQTAAGGALPMNFKHPFAVIKFVITEGSGTHVQINSISIADLKTGGTCTYNGSTMSWTGLSGSTAMSQTGLNLKYGTEITEAAPFIVIPNNYGSKTLTVNGTWDDWSAVSNKDISTNIDINWQPGCIYTYNLTVTKYALTVKTDKYTEQW